MSSNQDLWKILTGQSSLREPVSHVTIATMMLLALTGAGARGDMFRQDTH